MKDRIYRWRGGDGSSLEVLWLRVLGSSYHAQSWIVDAGARPFAINYVWILDGNWRTESLAIHTHQPGHKSMTIRRISETRWHVDELPRPDLDGCEEVDLSVTPFCNTVALLRFGPPPGGPGELMALYVSFPGLICVPSRQRYERLGPSAFKYIDLGTERGFEAQLLVDDDGFIRSYEGLFEAVE